MTYDNFIGTHFLSIVHPEYRDQVIKFYQNQVIKNIEITYKEFPLLNKNNDIQNGLVRLFE